MYYDSVGRKCNLIIGEVVTPQGLVPQGDVERLAAFGKEVRRRFGHPISETCSEG